MKSDLQAKSVSGQKVMLSGIFLNIFLGVIKSTAGLLGHSNVLIADGIDSIVDVFTSVMTWGALKYAAKPPDQEHPYGHGKAESLAAVAGALILLTTGIAITFFSIQNIISIQHGTLPHPPEKYTLLILLIAIVIKEGFFRVLTHQARKIGSTSMLAEAWHHRSDVMISLTAFIGIAISIFGGKRYANADDWAALLVCFIIFYNATTILHVSFREIMDAQVSHDLEEKILKLACEIDGVESAEKCRVRKSGLSLLADLHIRVDGQLSVLKGHTISHQVKDHLLNANLALEDITLHLEPN
ncbi:MAG: cation diffusion facilitator family transporter [Chthoniobacterales bacterium]